MTRLRPSLALALMLLAMAPIGPAQGDHGHRACPGCGHQTPKLDPRGSFHCICGEALFVDEPEPEPSP